MDEEVVAPLDTRSRCSSWRKVDIIGAELSSRGNYRNIAPRRRINRNSEIGTAERWDCLLFFYVEIVSLVIGPVHFVFHNGDRAAHSAPKTIINSPTPDCSVGYLFFPSRPFLPFFSRELKFSRKKGDAS